MHAASTYMLLDIGGSLWGTLAFAVVLLAPGYLAAWPLNLAGFRAKSPAEQLAWSVVLSFGIGTICIVALVWIAGMYTAESVLVAVSAGALFLFLRSGLPRPRMRLGYVVFLIWTAFVILSLVDIGSGSRLWMSVTIFDHSVRVPFVDAVMRTGVVPVNPLYWPGHDSPLRYYYFWYVLCGVIAKLAHISARQALIASCVWPAVAVAAMLALYGKYLLGWRGPLLRSRTRLAVAFLTITGMDVLIVLLVASSGRGVGSDMEWWSIDQVTSWTDVFLWVPHHAAALVCCLLSLLLFWMVRSEPRRQDRIVFSVIAGLSFASAFGLSTYVAIGFCFLVAFWLLRILFTGRGGRQFAAVGLAAVIACMVLAPYVLQLLHQSSPGGGKAPHFLSLQVRQMLSPSMLARIPVLARMAAHHPFRETQIAALLLLLPGYCIEFGFYVVVVLLALRLPNKSEGERTLLYLFAAAMVSVSFLRSTVIASNDYGPRATLLAQFFLLLLAVRVWQSTRDGSKFILAGLAFIGICGSLYQAVNLRLFLPVQEKHGNPAARELAERNFALRDAYAQLATRLPASARIQYGAPAGGYFDATHTLNAGWQIIAAGTSGFDCNTGFGGGVAACGPIREAGAALYGAFGTSTPPPTLPLKDAVMLCTGIGAEYLVVTRWDAVWRDTMAWPWRLPAIVATPEVRVVACRKE